MENLWSIMENHIYENQSFFRSRHALVKKIREVWKNLDPKILKKLSLSMTKRLNQVYINPSKKADY